MDHQWESSNDIPTFNKLLEFLETQLKVLKAVTGSKSSTSQTSSHTTTQCHTSSKSFVVKLPYTCSHCQGEHVIYSCEKFNSVTSGHFLIDQPLFSLPKDTIEDTHISPLKLVQQISQHFWRRWQSEYLQNLQQRSKWCKHTPNLQLGNLVLSKAKNTSQLRWRKGCISVLHPGSDRVVPVVEMKTSNGFCTRSITKVCPLPKCDTMQ